MTSLELVLTILVTTVGLAMAVLVIFVGVIGRHVTALERELQAWGLTADARHRFEALRDLTAQLAAVHDTHTDSEGVSNEAELRTD